MKLLTLNITRCWNCNRTLRWGDKVVTNVFGMEFCSTGCRHVWEEQHGPQEVRQRAMAR